jgi:hypothetical protein
VLEQLRSSTAQLCFEALDGRRNVWVLKPSYGSKGVGVRLLNGDEGLSAVLGERDSRRVARRLPRSDHAAGGEALVEGRVPGRRHDRHPEMVAPAPQLLHAVGLALRAPLR